MQPQLRFACGNDQVTTQAAAAMEAEVTGAFEKLGPLLQEKLKFFVKGDGRTQVCRCAPGKSLSLALMVSPCTCVCHNGKSLDVSPSVGTLVFSLVARFGSILCRV